MFIPKIKDRAYVAWIRTRPCAFCGRPGPSEAHHVRGIDGFPGIGRKPSDHLVLPACNEVSGNGCHERDQKYQSEIDIGDKLKMIIFHLSEYIETQFGGVRRSL